MRRMHPHPACTPCIHAGDPHAAMSNAHLPAAVPCQVGNRAVWCCLCCCGCAGAAVLLHTVGQSGSAIECRGQVLYPACLSVMLTTGVKASSFPLRLTWAPPFVVLTGVKWPLSQRPNITLVAYEAVGGCVGQQHEVKPCHLSPVQMCHAADAELPHVNCANMDCNEL